MEKFKVDAVVTQRSAEDGLTGKEVVELLQNLALDDNEEVYPIYAEGDSSVAFGFIRNSVITEVLGDEFGSGSSFEEALLKVVNDVELDSNDCVYEFAGVKTLMYY